MTFLRQQQANRASKIACAMNKNSNKGMCDSDLANAKFSRTLRKK